MYKFAAILLICSVHISAFAEQPNTSKNTALTASKILASEMGKTFQLAQNCGQDMGNVSATSAASLFRNYFEAYEVKIILKKYEFSVALEKGKSCNRGKVEFHVLMNKIAVFIRTAAPLTNK